MELTSFLSLLNEVYVRVSADNVSTPQCVDLVQLWARVIGSPRFTGNAKDIFNQQGSYYAQIVNTPDNFPQGGDIVIWSGDYNGGPGHCGIATGNGDEKTFDCFEQNDPTGVDCRVTTYNYQHVLGWLRPHELPTNQQELIDSLRKQRDDNWNLYQAEIIKLNNLQAEFEQYKKDHPIAAVSSPSVPVTEVPSTPVSPDSQPNIPSRKSFWESLLAVLNYKL